MENQPVDMNKANADAQVCIYLNYLSLVLVLVNIPQNLEYQNVSLVLL